MLKNNEKKLMQVVKLYNDKLYEACNNEEVVKNDNLKNAVLKIKKLKIKIEKFEDGKVIYRDSANNFSKKEVDKLIYDLEFTIHNFNYIFNKTLLEVM